MNSAGPQKRQGIWAGVVFMVSEIGAIPEAIAWAILRI